MSSKVAVAVIGAGPYGLSISAHLKAQGLSCYSVGLPMDTWLTQMPRGMDLKSAGFASSLYDPASTFTLKHYCQERAIPYADVGRRVSLETFSAYGLEFKRRFVPDLDPQLVSSIAHTNSGFLLRMEDGHRMEAAQVVIATGISHFSYIPPVFAALPGECLTHSSEHNCLKKFNQREVATVGAGASAIDIAALLHDAGASAQLVARRAIHFPDSPKRIPRPFWEEVKHPTTGLGAGWRSLFCVKAPLLFRQLPRDFRHSVVARHLGPAPAFFMKERVMGKVPMYFGWSVQKAELKSGRVHLELIKGQEKKQAISSDHVIAGTGYRVDLKRLAFLSGPLQSAIKLEGTSPALSANFECSVPGLYFVGAAASNTFGPLLRFAYGAGFTARRISRHLARIA